MNIEEIKQRLRDVRQHMRQTYAETKDAFYRGAVAGLDRALSDLSQVDAAPEVSTVDEAQQQRREELAAMAMQGLLAGGASLNVAERAYAVADEMLAEGSKR